MLAQQLGDFVHIYDKETAQMKASKSDGEVTSAMSDEDFKTFLNLASESDLEELLTHYTRLNNNASIFLGNSPSQLVASQWKATKPPLQRHSETRKHLRSHSAHALTSTSTQDAGNKRKAEQTRTQSAMFEQNRRLAGAIAAYGKSLDVNKNKRRPVSANVLTERKRMSSASLARPMSAKNRGNVAYERVMKEKSVSEALKQLAKRQAVRQYSARPQLKIETNKWMQPVENTDNSADSGDNTRTDRVTTSTNRVTGRTERVTAHSHYPMKWDQDEGPFGTFVNNTNEDSNKWTDKAGFTSTTVDNDRLAVGNDKTVDVHEGTQGDRRVYNVDKAFFSSVHKELQVTSKPAHSRETVETKQYEKQRSGTSRDKQGHFMDKQGTSTDTEHPSRIIRIPCGDEVTDVVTTGETKDKLGSTRQDYNEHMQMLIQRLAAHKFSNPSMEKVVPKPPTRPRSAKRPVSAQRMSRITTSHGSLI